MKAAYKAVISDMDGVLTHTSELHYLASKQLFNSLLEKKQGIAYEAFTEQE